MLSGSDELTRDKLRRVEKTIHELRRDEKSSNDLITGERSSDELKRPEDMKYAALVYMTCLGPAQALARLEWRALCSTGGMTKKRALHHVLLVRAMIQTKFRVCFAAQQLLPLLVGLLLLFRRR